MICDNGSKSSISSIAGLRGSDPGRWMAIFDLLVFVVVASVVVIVSLASFNNWATSLLLSVVGFEALLLFVIFILSVGQMSSIVTSP